MEHEFLEGFKPMNIESYDGTTNPVVWIEDFLLHIHMAHGDDLHAIKYLPLKIKGPARHWLNRLPENSIEAGKTWRMPLETTSKAPISGLQMLITSVILSSSPESQPENFGLGSSLKRTRLSIVQTPKP